MEKKNSLSEPPANQSQAVVRRALNGGSYAEAVKKSQPKVNPARREAKAKILKKLSKSVAKLTETLKEVNSEDGSIIPQQLSDNSSQQLSNNSSSNQPAPIGLLDQGTTPKKNMTAAEEQTTNFNQNEQSAISPNTTQREKEALLASGTKNIEQTTTDAPSKNTKPEPNNLSPNPPTLSHRNSSAKGTNLSQKACTSKTLFCQTHSSQTIDLTDKAQREQILKAVRVSTFPVRLTQSQLKAALQTADVSGLFQEAPRQTKQREEKKGDLRIERRKVTESVKCVPLETSSKAGAREDPATDIPQKRLDDSAVNAVHRELSNNTETSKESQKPPIVPRRPPVSSVSTDASVKSLAPHSCGPPTNTLKAPSDKQGITVAKVTPTSPSKFIDKDHQIQTKIAAQVYQVQKKMKEDLPLKSKVTEKENTETENKVKLQDTKPSPPSPQPPPRPEGRWHPFTTDWSCEEKVRCQHRENGKLPKNVTQW